MDDKTPLKKAVLLISVTTSFLTAFIGSSVNVALPSIENEFKIDAVTLAWISSSYLLTTAAFLLPFGKLADIKGRKKIFQTGLLVYTFFSLLSGFAFDTVSLITFRTFQGIGAAMIFGTGTAIVTSVFPVGERGKAMGYLVTAVYLGLSFGPFFGGLLTQYIGWRSIFYLNVPFGIFMAYLIVTKLKEEWADARGEKFDWIGSIVYMVALPFLMLGLSRIQKPEGIILLIVSVFLLIIFYLWESKVAVPILNVSLFTKNNVFAFSNLAALISYSATFAVGFLLSLYLQYVKGFPPRSAGFALALQPVTQAIFSSYAGKLSDRIEPRYVASFGMFLTTVGLFLLSFINFTTPLFFILIALIILGLGFAFFSSPNTNAIMSSVERRFYGVASASVGTMRLVGQMLSIGFTTMFFSLKLGNANISASTLSAFLNVVHVVFLLFAIICGLGIFASMARGNLER